MSQAIPSPAAGSKAATTKRIPMKVNSESTIDLLE
jgi:hypothetical protein